MTGDPETVAEDGVVADEFQIQRRAAMPAERRAAVIPGFVAAFPGDSQYPSAPSEAGLSPGTPLGGNTNDGKAVAGQ